MAADFSLHNGAARVILIDNNWRLAYAKSKCLRVETLDYTALKHGTTVTSKLREMVPNGRMCALSARQESTRRAGRITLS